MHAPNRAAFAALVAIGATVAVAACELVAGIEERELRPTATGGAGAGAGGATSSISSGGGGATATGSTSSISSGGAGASSGGGSGGAGAGCAGGDLTPVACNETDCPGDCLVGGGGADANDPCNAGDCYIDCTDHECEEGPLCPPGMPCCVDCAQGECDAPLTCGDASSCTIICAETCNHGVACCAESCEVFCEGGACNGGVWCSSATCHVECIYATDCMEGVVCERNRCEVRMDGTGPVDCESACECTTTGAAPNVDCPVGDDGECVADGNCTEIGAGCRC